MNNNEYMEIYNKGLEQGNITGACNFANRLMQREDIKPELCQIIKSELEMLKEKSQWKNK